MNDPITGWILPTSMFGLMLGMGLTLTLEDFRRIARVPGPVVLGTLLQLVVMPVCGFALAIAYELPPMLAAGLVIVAACPGGMLSNMAVYLGRGNTALSITLTATATAATLLTMPFWIRGILASSGGGFAADGTAIDVPILGTALELGGLTIVPVALGMVLRYLRPSLTRLERALTFLGMAGVFGTLGYDAAVRPDPPTELFALSLTPALLLCSAAAAFGFAISKVLGHSLADAVTIAVEICLKNGLLGMVVASSTFGVLEPSIPIIAYTGAMMPFSVVMLTAHGFWVTRRAR